MNNAICIPIDEELYVSVTRLLQENGAKGSAAQLIGQLARYGLDHAQLKPNLFFPEIVTQLKKVEKHFIWKHPDFRKAIMLADGTQAKMEYPSGNDNYAAIKDGMLLYNGRIFNSFSRLANHIAKGTSRSAPRDFFIKKPSDNKWHRALNLFEAINR